MLTATSLAARSGRAVASARRSSAPSYVVQVKVRISLSNCGANECSRMAAESRLPLPTHPKRGIAWWRGVTARALRPPLSDM